MSLLTTAYDSSILKNMDAASGFSPNLTQPATVSVGGITSQYESIGGPLQKGGRKRRVTRRRSSRRAPRRRIQYGCSSKKRTRHNKRK
jgi:hypothetical protein